MGNFWSINFRPIKLTPSMKSKLTIFFALYLFFSNSNADSNMPYDESADAKAELVSAMERSKKENVFLLIEFGANYCPDCRQLAQHFKTEKINSWIEKNVMVLPIDVGMSHEVNKDIAIRYGNPVRSGIPSLVLLNPSGKMVFSTSKGELARARDINKEDLLLWLRANLGTLIK